MTHDLGEQEFAAWLDRYKAAWEQRDADLAASIFTEDATYRETPFDAPMEGRGAIGDYWRGVTAGQKDVRFSYEILGCSGDEGICRWHATFAAVPSGDTIDMDGIFRCRFASAQLVRSLEEWWHIRVTPAAG